VMYSQTRDFDIEGRIARDFDGNFCCPPPNNCTGVWCFRNHEQHYILRRRPIITTRRLHSLFFDPGCPRGSHPTPHQSGHSVNLSAVRRQCTYTACLDTLSCHRLMNLTECPRSYQLSVIQQPQQTARFANASLSRLPLTLARRSWAHTHIEISLISQVYI
jgi:hypothetical protein